MSDDGSRGTVSALLGPTNTGKTYRAIERMLGHQSGMIGLPLRLLAREVYDRMSAEVGEEAVALVTGEEKRVPERPRYWVCTTESMPMDREVDVVVVDEIQLAADRQRGHVFTDRLLRARGRIETWFLGAQTVAPLIRELLPGVRIDSRARLSELRYAGESTLSALPPRSAIVAFSAATVYELAERLRRRRGGAAVVLGALSPRTRNAQVAMYQAGEVDYIVATDAIGMGLNMDVDHVAFAATSKYDGRELRPLERDELAQIAGRAGRYQRDGSFGVLSEVAALPHSVVRAIERHRFAPLSHLIWRNSELDLCSPGALIASLRARSPRSALRRIERADDFDALTQLTADPQILRRASSPSMTRLLWDVCRIPDFRGLLLDSHIRLLARIFAQLSSPPGRLHRDWMARRIARLDDTEGDIATLMGRIAFIRTWTYIAHHPEWVADASHWQGRTAAIENSLSDALHERLTERFVCRRERTRSAPAPVNTIDASNPFRCLIGLDLPDGPGENGGVEVENEAGFVDRVVASSQAEIGVQSGVITFEGRLLARLRRGKDLLHPELVLAVDLELGAGARSQIHRRLLAWLRDQVAAVLGPLLGGISPTPSPALRGLIYQLSRDLGTTLSRSGSAQVGALRAGERGLLRRHGVFIGRQTIYLLQSLTVANIARRMWLVEAFLGAEATPSLLVPGVPSVAVDHDCDRRRYLLLGYRVAGSRALRADALEEYLIGLMAHAKRGIVPLLPGAGEPLGVTEDELPEFLDALGFEPLGDGRYRRRAEKKRRHRSRR